MERFGSAPHTPLLFGQLVRTIFSFAFAALITAFLWATLLTQPAAAESQTASATATWQDTSLQYKGLQFEQAGKAQRNQFPGVSQDAVYFIHTNTPPTTATQGAATPRDALIIYLSAGVDPPSATSAQHVALTYNPADDTYTNPADRHTITIEGDYGSGGTSCAIEGIGWIICGVSSWLAKGMDWVFSVIDGFMEVQPLAANNTSGLYIGWNIMRNFANVAFIIAFLIIIYAQVTGVAAGTYGIKKLLPRLLIAAILVNLSYLISALAIDLSNIIGYSLQNIFIEMRDQILTTGGSATASSSLLSWESITGAVLSGGTGALAAVIGVKAAIGYGTGLIYLLLPAMVGLLLAVLVVLLVLAARQAIITILVLISPLAFVAYLLPGTEKWFERWRTLFMTMLIFFPAFSVVFGGSQLAGSIIIMNADSINVVLLGMIVQVAPLVITPFLLKFSGSLLGRVAGMVNDPNRGILDRTRKFSQSKAGISRDRFHGNLDRKGRPRDKKLSAMRKMSMWAASHERTREEQAASAKTAADTEYRSRQKYKDAYYNEALINTDKERVDAQLASDVEHQKADKSSPLYSRIQALEVDKQSLEASKARATIEVEKVRATRGSDLHLSSVEVKAAEATLEQVNAQNARMIDEYKSGLVAPTGQLVPLMNELKESSTKAMAEKLGAASAQYEVQRVHSNAMNEESIAGDALRKVAASVGGHVGETRARASAISTLNKLDEEALKVNIDLVKAEAALNGTTSKDYSTKIVEAAITGQTTFNGRDLDTEQIKAALQMQAQENNISLFEKARGSLNMDQALVSEIISMNVGNFKAAGGFHLQNDPSLNVQVHGANYERELAKARIQTLSGTTAENLANLKAGWVENLIKNPDEFRDMVTIAREEGLDEKVLNAYMAMKKALNSETILGKLDDREGHIRAMEKVLAESFNNEKPTDDPRPKADDYK